MAVRLEIALKPHLFDAEGFELCRKIREYFGWHVEGARVLRVIMLETGLSLKELEEVRREIFTNPVSQISSFRPLATAFDFQWAVWVGYRPGVRDTAGSVALEAIADYLRRPLSPHDAAYTSKIFLLQKSALDRSQVETIARELLANDIIQQWRIAAREEWDSEQGIGIIIPKVALRHTPAVETIAMESDEQLKALSDARHLALNPRDIPVIRRYFLRPEVLRERARVGLHGPTDVELEAISQARSDHCNHNTFRGLFLYKDLDTGRETVVDNLFKTCIEAPTLAARDQKNWVVSVLWDNAGAARFDEDHLYVITGETHNSPSTMEAYGGALTGIVGVYRDPMGTGKGSRLIAGLYGYCVGPRDYAGPLRPHLHPRRLLDGVVAGVRDGGNKHGVPTVFGNLFHHPSYLGKCLVFVAAIGLMPRTICGEPAEQKKPHPGDIIIMAGGRVGKDGIHGVTASSEGYSEQTPAGHVQIGDPYTQKKMHDFLLEARDEGLITFITDNGGGGLSSSIGESAHLAGGAHVALDRVPLKYEGLDVWEIWVSESQERMTVAVRPENVDRFMELAALHEVECTAIGRYEDTGKLHLTYHGKTCGYLDLSFFREDFPQWQFEAHWRSPASRGLTEPVLSEPTAYGRLLIELLASPNLCSREWIQRQYDHEVQGSSVIKLLVGRRGDVPNDAAVLRPVLTSRRGLAVTQALHPTYGQIDTYHMVAASIDECVRRLLAVGGLLNEIGGVDNFCWPSIQYDPKQNPDGRYKAAQLVRANWALRDMCLAYGIPLLSGKDSMYVDGHLPGPYGERHKVSGLPTMQFTATSIVEDIERCLTMDLKMPGDWVYVLGTTRHELGGSEYYEKLGYVGLSVPKADPEKFLRLYQALEAAVQEGLVASCRAVGRGGLAVHGALSAIAGELGMAWDLGAVPVDDSLSPAAILFSESLGRFLVTVAPRLKDAFEAHFRGLPMGCLGRVSERPVWTIRDASGQEVLEESVEALGKAWRLGPAAGVEQET
ncbi:AIR synthase-related protein [Desulfosoma sp.]|uniref:AIR synthase-related protein n=1 Tax=Desulfosoma sp. TaxID=2603217 RepID=UPI00404ACD9A